MRKKEIAKDYAIDAFIYYAEQGKPTDDEINRMTDKNEAELKDLLTVQKVYRTLDDTAKNIIDTVYFENSANEFSTKNMKLWISNASLKTSIDEKKIRAILKKARIEFATERWMRI